MSLRISSYVTLEHPALPGAKSTFFHLCKEMALLQVPSIPFLGLICSKIVNL